MQHARIVEKNDARDVGGIDRFAQKRPNQHIGAARFVDDGAANAVEFRAKNFTPIGHRAMSEVRAAGDDDSRRLAAGVRIDDLDALQHL